MLAPLPPLLAYRLDRARSADATDLSSLANGASVNTTSPHGTALACGVNPDDEVRWVRTAVTLDRAARSRRNLRDDALRQFLQEEGVHALPDAGISYAFIENAARREASQMEDWTFLRLAHTTLAALSAILPDAMVPERGRVLAQRARVAFQLGATEAARIYYDEVKSLGSAFALSELTALARIGHAVLAQLAGNLPQSRALFEDVLNAEDSPAECRSLAHQGLMIASAEVADFDQAVQHAWSAYEGVASTAQGLGMLVNLAQILLDAGQPAAALRGFAAALGKKPHPRIALPAFGGIALAAVAARRPEVASSVVMLAATRTQSLVAALGGGPSPVLPYQSATALVEISEALGAVGEMELSVRCAAHASQIAALHKFNKLSYRLENAPVLPTVTSTPTVIQREIAERLEMIEGAELVGV